MSYTRIGIGILAALSVLDLALSIFIAYQYQTPKPVVPEAEVVPNFILVQEMQSAEFVATGYAIGPPYSSITKNGSSVFDKGSIRIGGVDIFTVAVDPKVIPLGSLVYIDSLGIGMATDTGRLIKGMIVDICFSSMDEAMRWGRRNVNVTVLRRGR